MSPTIYTGVIMYYHEEIEWQLEQNRNNRHSARAYCKMHHMTCLAEPEHMQLTIQRLYSLDPQQAGAIVDDEIGR